MYPRVVITGIGMISCVGNTTEETWQSLLEGKSGIRSIPHDGLKGFVAGTLPLEINLEKLYPDIRLRKRVSRFGGLFVHMGVTAAKEALEDSKYPLDRMLDVGVILGAGIGGAMDQIKSAFSFEETKENIHFQSMLATGVGALVAGVCTRFGLQGPSMGIQNACSSAGSAIAAGFDMIRNGRAKGVLAGGSEAPANEMICRSLLGYRLHPLGYEDNPQEASRPFDKDRKGMITSDGACVVFLEEYESAKARGATIYSEIVGIGVTNDAWDFVSPPESGKPLENCILQGLKEAKLTPCDVDFVTAHATGSVMGDNVEAQVLHRIYSNCKKIPPIYACKSVMGHSFGASVAFEVGIASKAIKDSCIPPNINLKELSPENPFSIENFLRQKTNKNIQVAVTQGFGFGGVNVCLVQKKVE